MLSILTPLRSIGQPLPSYQLAWFSAARLSGLTRLPSQLLTTEQLAAEALGYVVGSDKPRARAAQPRLGGWWAWLSTAVLALVLLRVGIALRTARRFNRELATQVSSLLGYLGYQPSAPEPLASLPLAQATGAAPPDPSPFPEAAVPESTPAAVVPPVAAPHQQQLVHELRQAAEAALADAEFGPAQLAEQLALGERTLYRYIKELTGLTPAAYLRELRLQHAHQLLESQACPSVAEAAYQSGFNDPSYFGQVFQKRFGKKPSAYL